MPPATYAGPGALGLSRYASPGAQKAVLAAMPPDVSSQESTIATKEQIAAANENTTNGIALRNADAQLAVAQGRALKAEVDKHAAKLSRTVSTVVTNTRQLLALIHETLQKEGTTGTENVDSLWAEMDQLVTAAGDAKSAIPVFLEKQRNNMSLYHASMLNETIADTQEELNLQHKKINIQHNLILEHQEAVQAYKEQNAAKLKGVEDLQGQVSRLTLEKGNFRNEIDNYRQLLEKEHIAKAVELKKADTLEEELRTLVASKTLLLAEVDGLRKALQDLQAKMQQTEQQLAEKFTAELKSQAHQIEEKTQKIMDLKSLVDLNKLDATTTQMQAEKLGQENATLKEKYGQQTAEHAQAFSKLSEQTKKMDSLVVDLERQQEENINLKQRVAKFSELKKQAASLSHAKLTLEKQLHELSVELEAAKDAETRAKTELVDLGKKLTALEKSVDNLETENNDLLAEQTNHKKTVQALQISKSENLKLNAIVEELRSNNAEPVIDTSPMSDEEKKLFLEKIRGLETKGASLEKALEEWTKLAKV
ncbi:hypothetical protein T440DRAFT_54117 [Plenodomus tracheiphilus IPT5]|uniref:Uncharacterized protein n=1 Tax=Plenodomus tracheiphilus IPT5 TaxID=1408161 RepID=A0A6A7B7T4_9PLEO|nr:hypothetical protein T440DRAFT_54117 [Plenodomus tracheiphilus IPT5]